MKVVFTRFPFESDFGGIERVTIDLFKGLVKKGIEVDFYTNCPIFLDPKNKVEGINYKKTWFPKPPVSKWSIFKFLFFYQIYFIYSFLLARKFKNEGITHVFMLSFGEKIVLTPFLVRRGIKVFFVEHERIRRWFTKNPFFGRYKKNTRLVKVISVSDLFKDDLSKIEINSLVIPNGVDTSFWERTFMYKISDQLQVMTVARLRPEKGIYELLEVVKRLQNGGSFKLSLKIIGDGPERERLEKFVRDNRLNVKFLGALQSDKVREQYGNSDLAIFPSIERETSGLTPLEAMSMEVPVVVSDQFGSMVGVDLDGVSLYKYDDLDELYSKILTIKYSLQTINRSNLRKFVESNYSLEKMTEGYIKLLNE